MGIKTGKPRGRPPGASNKVRLAHDAALRAAGLQPLEYMLQVVRDEAEEPRARMAAAVAAAPYVHAKLSSVELGNKDGAPFRVVLESSDAGLL